MSLHDVQRQFMSAMYRTGVAADRFIKPSCTLSSNERLAIYRGSVRGGLLQALSDIYPTLNKLLGDNPFEGLCRRYIEETPSQSANIAEYGHRLAEFVASFKPLSEYPYMADVARLEWAWHQVFNESDSIPLDLERLGLMSPEQQMALKFHPPKASRLIHSHWPIHKIWQNNQPHQSDEQSDQTIELIRSDFFLLIWRREYEMRVDLLEEPQWHFLSSLNQTANFSAAIEVFLEEYPDQNVPELFATAVRHGWVATFE
ncbi:DNA-binding domain-containing protein [Alkalimarinus coralli]|uniref:HvfC/BufC N-terminal domain-containing protein n=1 Tax=Alkalimarinus coralli TaxID=2935863 RepID=UPI00202B38D8|nr:DNA-binding domain-containing protein [Alkalimarinus coralli]